MNTFCMSPGSTYSRRALEHFQSLNATYNQYKQYRPGNVRRPVLPVLYRPERALGERYNLGGTGLSLLFNTNAGLTFFY